MAVTPPSLITEKEIYLFILLDNQGLQLTKIESRTLHNEISSVNPTMKLD